MRAAEQIIIVETGANSGGGPSQGPTTFDPSFLTSTALLINDNLTLTSPATGAGGYSVTRTIASVAAGKFYCEMQVNDWPGGANSLQIGVVDSSFTDAATFIGADAHGFGWFDSGGVVSSNGEVALTGALGEAGDIVGMAFDVTNLLMWIRVNGGDWNGSGTANPATGTGGVSMSTLSGSLYVAACTHQNTGNVISVNFGQFTYANAAPSGFGNLVGTATSFAVPAVAATAGLNTPTFFDHFSSSGTIDLANTQAPGFNWYTRTNWPSVFGGNAILQTSPPTPSSILEVSNSVLEITTEVSGQNTNCLGTACAVDTEGTSFVGNAIMPGDGFYVEVRMQTDTSLANPSLVANWPICWMINLGTLIGNSADDNWVEFDVAEFYPTVANTDGADYAVHDWVQSTGANNQVFNYFRGGSVPINAQWHVYGMLYTPATKNSGVGLFEFYLDGVLKATIEFAAGVGSSPASTPDNVAGIFTEIANNPPYMIYLSAGNGWPAFYDYVGVWQ